MALESIYALDPTKIIADYLGVSIGVALAILAVVSIWALIWKGLALWKSAKKNQLIWFVVLLIMVPTIGILEILYIFIFSEMKLGRKKSEKKKIKRR